MTYHRSTYEGSGDAANHTDYRPWWLDNLAADATGEGAFMQGAAQGADQVRALVTYARSVYEYQEFNHFGDYDDGSRFIEDYTTQINGQPTGVIVAVSRNAAAEAQHIVVNHRPRSSVLLLADLCAEKFAGTPLQAVFADGAPDPRASVGATYLDNINGKTDYYPHWLDELADDVTLEGAAMEGTARGAETVRSIVLYARTLYEHQVFSYTGPYGDNGFLEQYTTPIKGEPTGVVVRVVRNAAGEAQHISVNHRPRSSVLLFSRLMGEKFIDTAIGEHFIAGERVGS